MLKTCVRCHVQLSADQFQVLTSGKLRSYCKPCDREYLDAWRTANRERITAERKARYEAMTEDDREIAKQQQREHYQRHRSSFRYSNLKARFGINRAEYEQMLADQGGACAICRKLPADKKHLAVDHDHTTGLIRGLLCSTCNSGLGHFQDNPVLLVAAAAYLRPPGR